MLSTSLPELGLFYQGKIRDNYTRGDKRYIISTDRISAFDSVFDEGIPHKGQILNELNAYFMNSVKEIVPVSFLEQIHPNVSIHINCKPIPVEFIVRGYISGSMWKSYAKGKRNFFETTLPDGLNENDKLPEVIITPTTKELKGHDLEIESTEYLYSFLSKSMFKEIKTHCHSLFKHGSKLAKKQGLILVDTKYEFGLYNGVIYLIDELHTPDSSRYFSIESYAKNSSKPDQLSKEFFRSWCGEMHFSGKEGQNTPAIPEKISEQVSEVYISLYEKLTGKIFIPRICVDTNLDIYQTLVNTNVLKGFLAVILSGSKSDKLFVKEITQPLEKFSIPVLYRVISAHKDPKRFLDIVDWLDKYPGKIVYVDVTGKSNGKGPTLTANTSNPVVHIQETINDDLFSSLNLPKGVSLSIVIGAENGAIAVAKIFSLLDSDVKKNLNLYLEEKREINTEDDTRFQFLSHPYLES